MSRVIPCVFLEPSEEAEESLRRFTFRSDEPGVCPGKHFGHDARVLIGTTAFPFGDGSTGHGDVPSDEFKTDPRWPTTCSSCKYVFKPTDQWQRNTNRLFTYPGGTATMHTVPVGGMYYADWYPKPWRGPDGHCLVVQTPAGPWIVDGPSRDADGKEKGRGWTRTGTVPNVTASPSIHFPGKYHGWLRDGNLVEC